MALLPLSSLLLDVSTKQPLNQSAVSLVPCSQNMNAVTANALFGPMIKDACSKTDVKCPGCNQVVKAYYPDPSIAAIAAIVHSTFQQSGNASSFSTAAKETTTNQQSGNASSSSASAATKEASTKETMAYPNVPDEVHYNNFDRIQYHPFTYQKRTCVIWHFSRSPYATYKTPEADLPKNPKALFDSLKIGCDFPYVKFTSSYPKAQLMDYLKSLGIDFDSYENTYTVTKVNTLPHAVSFLKLLEQNKDLILDSYQKRDINNHWGIQL